MPIEYLALVLITALSSIIFTISYCCECLFSSLADMHLTLIRLAPAHFALKHSGVDLLTSK